MIDLRQNPHTVDGRNPANEVGNLSLIYNVIYIYYARWLAGFLKHQQYFVILTFSKYSRFSSKKHHRSGITCEAGVLLTDVSACTPVVQEGQVQQVWKNVVKGE